jgi:hypothetical protein
MPVKVEYCFASEEGDITADGTILERPFLLSPSKPHPFLILRDYFDAIRQVFMTFFTGASDQDPGRDSPEKILIRSEKHGALYHVASAECILGGGSWKFSVSTAVTDRARAFMNREEALLRQLDRSLQLPYLPKVFLKAETLLQEKQALSILLAEWFEDYHEWHLTGADGRTISIWDRKRGNRAASLSQISGLYREMARILTLYYDPVTFRRIGPWSHGAGDFIVKTKGDKVSARLTTVRGYEASPLFNPAGNVSPLLPFMYFFLELTLKMRLDRLEGTGEGVWADGFCIKPVVEGFLDACRDHPLEVLGLPLTPGDFLSLLRSFGKCELEDLFQPLLALYRQEEDQDWPLIEANVRTHANELSRVIRSFPV